MKGKKVNGVFYPLGENYRKPKKNHCYLYKDNKYYVYYGEYNGDVSSPSGLYKKGNKIYKHVSSKTLKSKIDKDLLVTDILQNKNKVTETMDEIKNILTEEEKKKIFAPKIKQSDDILIKLIKEKLINLQVPEKILKSRFETDMQWNNYKRALTIRSSITIDGFAKWMEVLGIKWEIHMENE